jgi:hypothetical protein
VHTVGGVINNGETIMRIVARADELVVEAKVALLSSIRSQREPLAAVRIMSGNQRPGYARVR